MGKSNKRRHADPSAAVSPSPNNDGQRDASATAAASPSTPLKPTSPAPSSSPLPNGASPAGNDDPSTWSKSKKKRMRMKRKKEAIRAANATKRGPMGEGDEGKGAGASDGTIGPGKPSNGGHKRPRKNSDDGNHESGGATQATAAADGGGGGGSVGSPKRKKKKRSSNKQSAEESTPKSSPMSHQKPGKKEDSLNTKSADNLQEPTMAVQSPVAERKTSSPKKEKHHNTQAKAQSGDSTEQSPSESSPTREVKENETAEDGSSPKKKKRKKKKKNKKLSGAHEAGEGTNAQPTPKGKGATADNRGDDGQSKPEHTKQSTNSPQMKITLPHQSRMSSLQKAFLERLTSSRFRELNEELYTQPSHRSLDHFTEHPELFEQYHVGFRRQAAEWPVNPVDVIYKKIVKDYSNGAKAAKGQGDGGEKQVVVADFGCGDAKLAERLLALRVGKDGHTLEQAARKKPKGSAKAQQPSSSSCPFIVHSFDLVSGGNKLVTPADMANVPLDDASVDVAVYCLALMGTNVADFVREAWRVLRIGGVLRVAEVRSRFETAAPAGDDDTKGGGKRGKLNNGKKHKRKVTPVAKGGAGNDDEGAPKPLMLLDEFHSLMERCGFECKDVERSNKMFLFMDFVKAGGAGGLSEKERFSAKPCIYKRR